MLSKKDKLEILEDGLNESRKYDFRMIKTELKKIKSLDEYIKYLDDVQKVFGQFKISKKTTKTNLNKL